MSYISCPELIPEEKRGLEHYKFVVPSPGTIYVYKNSNYRSPLNGLSSEDWLCCTEGWHRKEDGVWHETVHCGWKPDRIAKTIEDIFDHYRNKD